MAKIDLRKTVYNKDQFSRVVGGREFTTFGVQDPASVFTIQDFFDQYENLFLSIPINGDSNSHEYLVRKSGELVGFQRTTEDIQPLLDEIASLRDQLLTLQQENIDLQIGDATDSKLQDQFTEILAQLAEPPPPFPEIILPDVIINQGDTNISVGSGGYVLEGDTIDASILGSTPIVGRINVFNNDNIPENVKLTLAGIERQPEFGTAVVEGADGRISYRPNRNAPSGQGIDSFSYKVADTNGVENIVEVSVNIRKRSNEPPKVETQKINVSIATDKEITSQAIKLLSTASDLEGGDLTYGGIKDKPKYGSIEVMDPEEGIVRYIPSIKIPSGNGVDTFTFTVSDDIGQTSVGTVVVNAVNQYITFVKAGADIINIDFRLQDGFKEGDDANQGYVKDGEFKAQLTKNLLENDFGANIRFNKIENQPTYGTLQVSDDGIVTYTPRLGVGSSGFINLNAFVTKGSNETPVTQDTFSYSIINENSSIDTATVTVNFDVLGEAEKSTGTVQNDTTDTTPDTACGIIQSNKNPADVIGELKDKTSLKCEDITYDWSKGSQQWNERTPKDTCYKLEENYTASENEEASCGGNVYVYQFGQWVERTQL
jgi:hypothetical protein